MRILHVFFIKIDRNEFTVHSANKKQKLVHQQFADQYVKLTVRKPMIGFACQAKINNASQLVSLSSYLGGYFLICKIASVQDLQTLEQNGTVLAQVQTSIIALVPFRLDDFAQFSVHQIAVQQAPWNTLFEESTTRSIHIIDSRGILRHSSYFDTSIDSFMLQETVRLVQAFKTTDVANIMCPANWQPLQSTIIPTPTESKLFFANKYK